MKTTFALFAALCPFVAQSVCAQLTAVDSSYQAVPYFTHSNADGIVSYDWASNGSVYYQTSDSNFNFGGLYRYSGGAPTQVVAGSSSAFSGASVVSIGQYVYYNNSSASNGTENIYKYGPVGGSPTTVLASNTTNYGLYQNQGRLFITGAPGFGTNHIYYSNLGSNGNLLSSPAVDLGADSGGSGPLAFDQAGNLFYAPGYGDLSIYRWSAADVSAAIANPTANPLGINGHLWLSYGSLYGNESGGSSMLLDQNGDLLLTLTSFSDPSVLVKFGVGTNGAYDGVSSTLFQDTETLGELRLHDNGLYLSAGNEVFNIVPEPSSICLLILSTLCVGVVGWRRVKIVHSHPAVVASDRLLR